MDYVKHSFINSAKVVSNGSINGRKYIFITQPYALQPFLCPTYLEKRLHSSLSPARFLQRRIPRIRNAPFWTMSSHLIPRFSTDLLLNFPIRTFIWDPFFLHPCDVTHTSWSSDLNIIQDI